MTGRRWGWIVVAVLAIGLAAVGVSIGLERLFAPPTREAASAPAATPTPEVPHVAATLFYPTADGQGLTPVRRDVPLAGDSIAQGRQVVTAQVEDEPPAGVVSAIPAGTRLRAFYVTQGGDAIVDLTGEVTSGHPGGTSAELLTVHAIVNAVTANMPAIRRVQILVDGQEVDTLAGHVDLRHPLPRDTSLVRGNSP